MEKGNSSSRLFREKAMQNLSSPEELDHLITVTGRKGWMALAVLGLGVLFAIGWGVFGRVTTTINGTGIILRGSRLTQVVAQGSGQVKEISVKVGDRVGKGQVVGRITQPVLSAQVDGQNATVLSLQKRLKQVSTEQARLIEDRQASFAEQRTSLGTAISDYQKQYDTLQEIVNTQKGLLAKGLVTRITFLDTQKQFNQARLSLLQAKEKLADVATQELTQRNQSRQVVFDAEDELQKARDSLAELRIKLENTSRLVSNYNGIVADVCVFEGQTVNAGTVAVVLEEEDLPLTAVLYFPASKGKEADVGMSAEISPSTAAVDQYGYMVGDVIYAADVPATRESMDSVLQNENLVGDLCKEGAPIRLDAMLDRNSDNFSGIEWSSSHGPRIRITPGTVCTARVIVRQQPPITLVVPALKKFFGIED